jgi:ribosomal protein S18 acetylase RimI-like enzyme
MIEIRLVDPSDLAGLKAVLDTLELFPSQILEDLISDYFHHPNNQDIWFTVIQNDMPISIGYCAPEKLTEGTYNLYVIGVRSDMHRKGIGSLMMKYIENHLRQQGHRILIVETSGRDAFKLTRKFYENLNYTREAVIRDFWKEGMTKWFIGRS